MANTSDKSWFMYVKYLFCLDVFAIFCCFNLLYFLHIFINNNSDNNNTNTYT